MTTPPQGLQGSKVQAAEPGCLRMLAPTWARQANRLNPVATALMALRRMRPQPIFHNPIQGTHSEECLRIHGCERLHHAPIERRDWGLRCGDSSKFRDVLLAPQDSPNAKSPAIRVRGG